MNTRDQQAPSVNGSSEEVFALARRVADYTPEQIFGRVTLEERRADPDWEALPEEELPWRDSTVQRETTEPEAPRRSHRLLTGLAAAVALIVLVAGLTFAHLIRRAQPSPVGPPEPAPSASTVSPAPDSFSGLDAAGRAALVKSCTHAYAQWAKDSLDKQPSTTGYTLRAAVTGTQGGVKVTSGVMSDGKTRLVCNTKPSDGMREPSRDTVTSPTSKVSFAFSDSDTENYGLSARDLVWAGGRLPDSVAGLSYTWPDQHVAKAAINHDGYWVMQYLAPRMFTTGNYGDLSPAVITLTMRDGSTRTLKLGWDVDTSCAAVNLGGC